MRKMIVYWTVATCTCLVLHAQNSDEQVGRAAADPQQVAAIVATMKADEVPAFAGKVMQATANMPVSPKLRLRQLTGGSGEFLTAIAPEETPALLGQLIVNIPFQMLPGWVSGFKPAVDEKTAAMDDAAFDQFSSQVLKQIDANEALSDEDKTIYTTFAIVLLARGKTVESNEAYLERMLAVLPETYRAQVAAAAPAALAGDYSLLLGPQAADRLVTPQGGIMGQAPVPVADPLGVVTLQPNLLIYDVNRPFPLPVGPEGDDTRPPRPPQSETETTPVVPPPYRGQF